MIRALSLLVACLIGVGSAAYNIHNEHRYSSDPMLSVLTGATRQCQYEVYRDVANYLRVCRDRDGRDWTDWREESRGILTGLTLAQALNIHVEPVK